MNTDVELSLLAKNFNGFWANKDISFKIKKGSIHALCGENGAGKTTAMNMLCGLLKPTSGKILFGKTEISSNSAWSAPIASALGIGMVHQHLMLAASETILDNIVLGAEKTFLGFRNRKKETDELQILMKQTGLSVPLEKTISEIPLGLQSRCEILKVLYRKAKFLIFDEPTAVLTPQETELLLETFQVLKNEGHTILFVSHKLKEVLKVADNITVIRAGKTIQTLSRAEANLENLSSLIVGEKIVLPKNTFFDLAEKNKMSSKNIFDFEFPLLPGTVTGIAGVEGNGQTDLAYRLLSGARKSSTLDSVSSIPADRHHEGLILNFSLYENLRLSWKNKTLSPFTIFKKPTLEESAILKKYDVRPPNVLSKAKDLSGGNQQKVIAARELDHVHGEKSFILAINPTRGVDLGAIRFLHSKILECVSLGACVVLISNELDELMALSNRIGVLYRGQIVNWFEGPVFDEFKIGQSMLTGSDEKK